jgi:ubiquitin-protein ligase
MQTNKRLVKEIMHLIQEQNNKPLLDNDYLVDFDDININKVRTIIKCPQDSAYRHKFIRLDFDIPNDYPHSPPKVTFVNFDGVRIHPNMYEDGKCCSTILNTWPSENEKWTSSFRIETVLLTFMSFLDNNPYTYEPGGRDDTSYTDFVLHQSWKTCLLRYLNDPNQPEIFSRYIESYMSKNIDSIYNDLTTLEYFYPPGYYETVCFEIDLFYVNYSSIIEQIDEHYSLLEQTENDVDNLEHKTPSIPCFKCEICFDTETYEEYEDNLECEHHFHKKCLENHIKNNGNVCPMCRRECVFTSRKRRNSTFNYILNPTTKRRIKIGGKVYNSLLQQGVKLE